jgi:hypothetical protein
VWSGDFFGEPLSSEQGPLSPEQNLMLTPQTPSLSLHPALLIVRRGFKITWRPAPDGEWVRRRGQGKGTGYKVVVQHGRQRSRRTVIKWRPTRGNGNVGKRSVAPAHFHSASSMEWCKPNQIKYSRNLFPALSCLRYLGIKLGSTGPWFISIFHMELRTTYACVMRTVCIIIIIIIIITNFYACTQAYSPFSPHNGMNHWKCTYLTFLTY